MNQPQSLWCWVLGIPKSRLFKNSTCMKPKSTFQLNEKYQKQFNLYVVRIPDVIHDLMAVIDVVVTALDVVTRLYLRDIE